MVTNELFADALLEKTIIGETLLNSEALRTALDELRINDFVVERFRAIFTAMIAIDSRGKNIDPLVIVAEFPESEKAEIKNLLYSCASEIVSTVAYAEHIELLKKKSARMWAYQKTLAIRDALEEDLAPAELQMLVDDLAINSDLSERKIEVNSSKGFSQFIANIGRPKEYFRTGIIPLDNRMKIGKGHYFVIGARPSQGKTALSLQMAVNMSERHKVIYFSFETSSDRLYERIIARSANIDYGKIVNGGISEPEINKIKNTQAYFEALDLLIVEAAGMTVEQVRATATKHHADIIFIDYLGLVATSTSVNNAYERTTQISMALHNMAQRTGIAIVALCQLSRQANKAEPDMSSLRDSGQIEQDADEIVFIHTPDDENKQDKRLIVAKNKDGECGTSIVVEFVGKYQRFQKPFEASDAEYTDIPFSED